jgi:Flp pilus assembly protein TadB
VNYPLCAALSFAAYTYIRLGISKEAAWRAEVFGQSGRSLKEKVIKWMEQKSSSGLRARLDRIDVPIRTYLQTGALMIFAFSALLGLAGGSIFWALIGAGLAYGIHFLRYFAKHHNWREEMLSEMGNLASLLKIRLIVGDTVSQAIPAILPVLHGVMAVAWTSLVTEIAAGVPLPEALDRLADKVSDRDMSAVLLKLKTYHREGVPLDNQGKPDPFGDMAAKIERSSAKRVKYFTKRLTGPLTIITGVGFLTCSLWLIPYFWEIISSSLSQM